MLQADVQSVLDTINNAGEQLFNLAEELDIAGLEKELPEYTQLIEQYFLGMDKNTLTATDAESLKKVMDTHLKIVSMVSEKKEKVSNNIKQLQTGKEMQNTYPKTK